MNTSQACELHLRPSVSLPWTCLPCASQTSPSSRRGTTRTVEHGKEGQLVAIGALKELTPTTASAGGHGEIKSMRTSVRHLRQGAAQAILMELLQFARQRGYERVSLETGSTPPFEPAVAMYRRFGFVACGPFAD